MSLFVPTDEIWINQIFEGDADDVNGFFLEAAFDKTIRNATLMSFVSIDEYYAVHYQKKLSQETIKEKMEKAKNG